jgi:hypothetical protein
LNHKSIKLTSFSNRFPFIASEIFNCEINALLDRFFDAPEQKKKESSDQEEEEEEDDKSVSINIHFYPINYIDAIKLF